MSDQETPKTYSPFEPSYLRHYKRMPDGQIKWDVEVEEPRRYVGGGIAQTIKEADVAIERAITKDMKELAESFGF